MGFCLTYTALLMKTWRWVEISIDDVDIDGDGGDDAD